MKQKVKKKKVLEKETLSRLLSRNYSKDVFILLSRIKRMFVFYQGNKYFKKQFKSINKYINKNKLNMMIYD